MGQTYLDAIVFGDSGSESAHAFAGPVSFTITNTSVSPAATARRCSTNNPATVNGGSLRFSLRVDPAWRNYFTVKLWGGDDVSARSGQDSDMGRLYLYVAASNFVAGATTNYQIGYRHEGDYACLNTANYKQPLPGRFFYSTTLLPLWMTQGRTNLTLTIQAVGRIYDLGSGGPPSGNYQFYMFTNSRAIYQAYTHTEPALDPAGEAQGAAPATVVRPASGSASVLTLSPGGKGYYDGVSNYLSGRLSTDVTNLTVDDVMHLAKAYGNSNFQVTYLRTEVVARVAAAADRYASNYYSNPALVQGWGGNYGPLGWAIHLLSAQLQASLDATNDYGSGGLLSRRKAWGAMLLASRDYGRSNRNTLSNQGLISGTYIYQANRGLLDLSDTNAFAELAAQRYLMETCGLSPWLGSDLGNGGSAFTYGTNYLQITPKGLSREWGYVGVSYGEMAFYAADFYSYTTNPVFLAQAVRMSRARAHFRRPAMEASGSSYYRTMEGIGLLAWRSAIESDSEFGNEIAYGDRTGWNLGLHVAAVTGDTNLIGYAKQMLADNNYFPTLSGASTLGNQGDSRDGLAVFDDYKTIAGAADSGVRLPMTDGQPDYAWADEEDGIIAAKHGSERLWLAVYYQAKAGTGVNGIGRFHYSTSSFDRYGMLEVTPQIIFGGTFYVRPNLIDKPEANLYVPPDAPLQSYAGERLPLGASDPLATADDPFRGKAQFWTARYGNFLIGVNRSRTQTYSLRTPSDFVSATNLIPGQMVAGAVSVGPQSSVVLYLSSATDSTPAPKPPLSLNAVGDATPRVLLDWSPASGAAGYVVRRSTVAGGPYTNLAGVAGTNYADTGVTRGVSYYYVVAATNAFGESYNSMEDSASGGLPSPWVDVDIGNFGTAGSGNYNNGVFTVQGAGSDIGSGSDSFHLSYLSLTNDGAIYARIVSASAGKVGIMLRGSTNGNSVMAAALLDRALNQARFATRASSGASPVWQSSGTAAAPIWLKVARAGNSFSGYYSSDGSGWTQLGTNVTISMSSAVVCGVGVTSFSTSVLSTGVLDNLYAGSWTPPPAAPSNLMAIASNAAVLLSWGSASNATGYHLKRSLVSGGEYIQQTSQNGTNRLDADVMNGTRYYYVVTATNRAGESAASSEAAARPISLTPSRLQVVATNNQVQLGWPAELRGWRLEAQTNPAGAGLGSNWFTLSGAEETNSIVIPLSGTNGSVFYRLTYP
jgi:hypothetical protein